MSYRCFYFGLLRKVINIFSINANNDNIKEKPNE